MRGQKKSVQGWGWGQGLWGWGGDGDSVVGMEWGWGQKAVPVQLSNMYTSICKLSIYYKVLYDILSTNLECILNYMPIIIWSCRSQAP